MSRRLLALWLVACALPGVAWSQVDDEALRQAKALFFDRQYREARAAWQGVVDAGGGKEAQSALYWVARCSESLGESERALAEYERYLAARPSDRALAEEARTSRVAASLPAASVRRSRKSSRPAPLETIRSASASFLASSGFGS